MKKEHSELICIVDRSGSMSGTQEEVIGGINELIKEQREVEGTANITIVLFDNFIETLVDNEDIKDVKFVDGSTYFVRGSTAMNDAIGMTIQKVGERLDKTAEDERPENVVVSIVTDGFENSSTEYSQKQVKDMIEKQTNEFNWTFSFTAANMDAQSVGTNLYGFNARSCNNYTQDNIGATLALFSDMSTSMKSIRTGSKK